MKSVVAGLVAASSLSLLTPAASAHITIDRPTAHPGEFVVLRFHATNEGTSAIRKVEFDLPDSVAFAYVTPRADDWTVTVERRPLTVPIPTEEGAITEVIDKVTYSGGRIVPGQLEIFDIEFGPIPDIAGERLQFAATQTFADGTQLRWADPVIEHLPEPEHPGPYLDIVDVPGRAGNDDWLGLDIIAIVVGGAGLVVGSTALWRTRRRV